MDEVTYESAAQTLARWQGRRVTLLSGGSECPERYEGPLDVEPPRARDDAIVFTVRRDPARPDAVNPDGVTAYVWREGFAAHRSDDGRSLALYAGVVRYEIAPVD